MIVAVWGGVSVPSFFGQDEPQAHFPQRDRLVRRKANALSTPVSQAHRMQRPAPRAAGHHGDTEKPSAQLGSSARDAPPPSTVASYLGISDKIHGTASNRSLRLDGRDKAVPPSSREQEDEVIRKAEAILSKRVMHESSTAQGQPQARLGVFRARPGPIEVPRRGERPEGPSRDPGLANDQSAAMDANVEDGIVYSTDPELGSEDRLRLLVRFRKLAAGFVPGNSSRSRARNAVALPTSALAAALGSGAYPGKEPPRSRSLPPVPQSPRTPRAAQEMAWSEEEESDELSSGDLKRKADAWDYLSRPEVGKR